jgi:hypothetical protein
MARKKKQKPDPDLETWAKLGGSVVDVDCDASSMAIGLRCIVSHETQCKLCRWDTRPSWPVPARNAAKFCRAQHANR